MGDSEVSDNANLRKALKTGFDEFYTLYADVEKELSHYWNFLKGKTVYCNCDDAKTSAFWEYFHKNFTKIGLKCLLSTAFVKYGHSCLYRYDGDDEGRYDDDKSYADVYPLNGTGDFRSSECVNILLQSDVIVTNPPFSLFREYINLLCKYDKKFIVWGTMNALTTNDCFRLFMNDKINIGFLCINTAVFRVPDDCGRYSSVITSKINDGYLYAEIAGVCVLNNFGIGKTNEKLSLVKKYVPEKYPKFDFVDIINVDEVRDIPYDYWGYMAVPITFLNKYNPEQFEIVDCLNRAFVMDAFGKNKSLKESGHFGTMLNGKTKYSRLIIRRKQ